MVHASGHGSNQHRCKTSAVRLNRQKLDELRRAHRIQTEAELVRVISVDTAGICHALLTIACTPPPFGGRASSASARHLSFFRAYPAL